MTYRGGKLLPAEELFAVFLGDWHPADPELLQLTAFCKWLPSSSYSDNLAEYNVGRGTFRGSAIVPWSSSSPLPGCMPTFGLTRSKLVSRALKIPQFGGEMKHRAPALVTDSQIQTYLRDAIVAGTLPPKTDQSLYMTFVQSGVTVVLPDGSASCVVFCGYHESDGNGLYYGVIPDTNCAGCVGTLTPFQARCAITAHEEGEAKTDAVPGTGWYNDTSGEIGDPCAWQTYALDGYTVQKLWLNSRNGCAQE
jgi:hypothetical protein